MSDDDRTLIREKHAQLDAFLPEIGADAWLVLAREGSDPNAPLVAGFEPIGEGALIFTRGGRKIAVVADFDRVDAEESGVYHEVIAYSTSFAEALRNALARLRVETFALDFSVDDALFDGLPYGLFLRLKRILDDEALERRVVSAEPILARLRSRKSPEEVRRVREAVRLTERIFSELDGFLLPGMSEQEVAEFLEMRQHHYDTRTSFGEGAYVMAGRYGVGHRAPSDRPIEAGDTLVVDMGVMVQGYTSDLQRSYYLLAPGEEAPPAEVAHRFRVAQEAMHAAVRAMAPGVMAYTLDELARAHLEANGVTPYSHALGHQIGRAVHDGGTLLARRGERYGERGNAPLQVGEIYAVEPGVPGTTGKDGHPIGVEQNVLVTETGAELLSTPQVALVTIT